MAALGLQVQAADGVNALILSGPVSVAAVTPIRAAIDQMTGPVVIDLAGVTQLDSTAAIGAFVTARHALAQRGSSLALRGARPHVVNALEFVGLSEWIEQ